MKRNLNIHSSPLAEKTAEMQCRSSVGVSRADQYHCKHIDSYYSGTDIIQHDGVMVKGLAIQSSGARFSKLHKIFVRLFLSSS